MLDLKLEILLCGYIGSGFPKSMNIGLQLDKKEGLQGQRGIGGFNVGGIQEQQNRKAKLYIGSTTDGSKQKAYTDYKGNMAKKWKGWGTALKPSFEPIIVARKPFKGSLVDNVIENGVGGINIDECRVEPTKEYLGSKGNENTKKSGSIYGFSNYDKLHIRANPNELGRFPANTILTYDDTDYDEVCSGFPYTKGEIGRAGRKDGGNYNASSYKVGVVTDYGFKDEGSASRYFYCAKASKKDRDEGLEEFKEYEVELIGQLPDGFVSSYGNVRNKPLPRRNIHPTVKPTELMQYLVRLVSPKHSTILDPFMGSGSTGKAVAYENNERNMDYKFIGVELDSTYMNIAKARILYADGNKISIETNVENNIEEVVVTKKPKQQRLF